MPSGLVRGTEAPTLVGFLGWARSLVHQGLKGHVHVDR